MGYKVIGADIADPDRPMDCRKGFDTDRWKNVDLLIHCAATIPPIDEREKNDLLVANDFAIDSSMWQWALRNQPGQIVYFSSSAAYPFYLQSGTYALKEDDINLASIAQPDAMYGMTKLMGEVQAQEAKRQGLNVLVLRPFTGYGEDQALTYPFPAFIQRAKERVKLFDIWGNGHQVRDFIHIDDIVQGTMAMLEQGFSGPVNMGFGKPTELIDLAKLIVDHIRGYQPAYRVNDAKPQGAFYRLSDATLLHSVYKPSVSLSDGIRRALAA
jgi:nucleoside-diphosphate-sugar epimerase